MTPAIALLPWAAMLLVGAATCAVLPALAAGPRATATPVTTTAPDFGRYKVEVDPIRVKKPVLSGKAANFKTQLSEALQDAARGPNFAGHFVIAEWGCGSGCIHAAVIDTNSGTVHFPPELEGASAGSGELDSLAALQYRPDNRLLLINGFPSNDDRYGVWAYEWTGTALRPLSYTPRRRSP